MYVKPGDKVEDRDETNARKRKTGPRLGPPSPFPPPGPVYPAKFAHMARNLARYREVSVDRNTATETQTLK